MQPIDLPKKIYAAYAFASELKEEDRPKRFKIGSFTHCVEHKKTKMTIEHRRLHFGRIIPHQPSKPHTYITGVRL
jgi:hypothetical protein